MNYKKYLIKEVVNYEYTVDHENGKLIVVSPIGKLIFNCTKDDYDDEYIHNLVVDLFKLLSIKEIVEHLESNNLDIDEILEDYGNEIRNCLKGGD